MQTRPALMLFLILGAFWWNECPFETLTPAKFPAALVSGCAEACFAAGHLPPFFALIAHKPLAW